MRQALAEPDIGRTGRILYPAKSPDLTAGTESPTLEHEMTASTTPSSLDFSACELALGDGIRAEANSVIDRMLAQIAAFRLHQAGPTASEAEHRLDLAIKSANDSLQDTLTAIQDHIARVDATLNRLNEGINAVRVGDEKWAEKEPVELLLRLSMGLTEQMAVTFRLARRQIECAGTSRISVAQGIALLRELEDDCSILHEKLCEISEKVRVRDALTEKALPHSDIRELDALNEPLRPTAPWEAAFSRREAPAGTRPASFRRLPGRPK